MTVYFHNPGEMDVEGALLLGAHMKTGDNPIGHFGSGLKFAIAYLLRTGHKINIRTCGKTYKFATEERNFRGKTLQVVTCNDRDLGFTTELGRGWECWQAFRELHSNALDECGGSTDRESEIPASADTVVEITGGEITDTYYDRGSIFLESAPIWASRGLEVHNSPSNYIFYRGVRCMKLPCKSSLTYNVLASSQLTEDRTFKYTFLVTSLIGTELAGCTEPSIFPKLLRKNDGIEDSFSFPADRGYSEEFLDFLEPYRDDRTIRAAFRSALRNMRPLKAESSGRITLSSEEEKLVLDALHKLTPLNLGLDFADLKFRESLGPGVYGLYDMEENQIYISREAVHRGINDLAATLYEEWIHQRLGYTDMSRSMQDYLLTKLISRL